MLVYEVRMTSHPRTPLQLLLTLPGLLAPTAGPQRSAPALARLIAQAGPPSRDPDGTDAMLASYYGIAHMAGTDCPLAPVRLSALGIDPEEYFWLAADPVTLVAGHDDVRLTGVVRDLGPDDAAALVSMLNGHFANDNIAFVAPRSGAWFVRTSPIALRTHPVAAVIGRALRDLLPEGPDANAWRRWQSEIQMLMHDHPVNLAREEQGKAPANSVWFSEGGTMPAQAAPSSLVTFADNGIARALAARGPHPAQPLPADLPAVLAASGDAALLVVALGPSLNASVLESVWTAPAWRALTDGKLAAVTLVADGADGAVAWTAQPPTLVQRLGLRFSRPDLARLLAPVR